MERCGGIMTVEENLLFKITQIKWRNIVGIFVILFSITMLRTTEVIAQSSNIEIRKVHLYGNNDKKTGTRKQIIHIYKIGDEYIEAARNEIINFLSDFAGTEVEISFEEIDRLWAAERYALSEYANLRYIKVTSASNKKIVEITLDSPLDSAEKFFCALEYQQRQNRNGKDQTTTNATTSVVFKRSNFMGYDGIKCSRHQQQLAARFDGENPQQNINKITNRAPLAIMGQSIFQNEVSGCRPRKVLIRTVFGNYEIFRCSTTIDGEKLMVAFDGLEQPESVVYINRIQEVDLVGEPSQLEIIDMAIQHYGEPIKEANQQFKTVYDWEDDKGTSLRITAGNCYDPNISIRCSTGYIDYTLTAGDFTQVVERLKAAHSQGQIKKQKF